MDEPIGNPYTFVQKPEFIKYYKSLNNEERKDCDRKLRILFAGMERYLTAIEDELIKRGENPEVTRD